MAHIQSVKKNNYTATTAPVKSNDNTEGYGVGSEWYYADARKKFICFDVTTDDAIWKLVYSDALVRNVSGVEITRGSVVYVNGASGTTPTIALAKADAELTSTRTLGFVLEDIADNGFGYVVTEGSIAGTGTEPINTSGIAVGAPIYLSAATAGAFTGIAPTAPNHLTILGNVLTAHATLGLISVRVDNGFETTELHDVSETVASADGQLLAWDETTDTIYKPTTIESTNDHLTVGYTGGANPSIDLTPVSVICYFPTGIEFGNTTQEYDVDGTTWVSAVAGGTLGGIPNEASGGHQLADCIAAVTTALDASYLAVREGTGAASATNPATVHFLFTDITSFDTLDLRVLYSGSVSHIVGVEFWNYTTSAWVRVDTIASSSSYLEISDKVFGSTNFIGTGGDAGKVKLQIIHDNAGNATHRYEFDLVSICDGGGGGGAAPTTTEFTDNTFRILDEIDNTKEIAFQASGVTPGNTRTVTMPDADVDLGATLKGEISVTLDEGGGVLTVGTKKAYRYMPYAGIITEVILLADQSGSIVVDVWKDTYANFPPTDADSVTASAPPTITTAIKSTDSTLTGWTKTFSAGDIFEFNIDSVSTITKCFLILKYDKTGV